MQSTLTLPALCRNYAAVEALVSTSARAAGLAREQVQRLLLAVDELWRRLVEPADRLGLPEKEREAEVCIEIGEQCLRLFLTDELDREGLDASAERSALDFARTLVDRVVVEQDLLGGRCVCLEVDC